MTRIPAPQLLDQAITEDRVTDIAIDNLAITLAAFYRERSSTALSPTTCVLRLVSEISENRIALSKPHYQLSKSLVERVAWGLMAYTETHNTLLEQRFATRLVDGHGDLRPEHVCLSEPPEVIDCLGFSASQRLTDPVGELAFLDMECSMLGNNHIGHRVFAGYSIANSDSYPESLRRFYQAYWAMFRANLSAGHIDDPEISDPMPWLAQANRYLLFAADTLEHLQGHDAVEFQPSQ